MRQIVQLIALTLLLPSLSIAANFTFDADHSTASFSIKHLMITNVKGSIPDIGGLISFDDAQPEKSTFKATLGVASIDTRNKKRDDHLRSPDFFNVQKFPNITFDSQQVKKVAPALYQVDGNLTISGVTKPVTLTVEGLDQEIKDPWGNIKRGARLTTTIDRRDFGMTWNKAIETGGVVVGHKVSIEVELELIRQ